MAANGENGAAPGAVVDTAPDLDHENPMPAKKGGAAAIAAPGAQSSGTAADGLDSKIDVYLDRGITKCVLQPCCCFWGVLCGIIFFSFLGALGASGFSAQSSHEFTVTDSEVAVNYDALDDAIKNVESLDGSNNVVRERELKSSLYGSFSLLYKWTEDGSTSSFFTPANLKQVCEFEADMFTHPDYPKFCVLDYDNNYGQGNTSCVPPSMSVARLFYDITVLDCDDTGALGYLGIASGNGAAIAASQCATTAASVPLMWHTSGYGATGNGRVVQATSIMEQRARTSAGQLLAPFNYSSCALLSDNHVNMVSAYLQAMLATPNFPAMNNITGEELFGFFFDVNAQTNGYTPRTRSFMALGAPLAGYADESEQQSKQRDEYAAFVKLVEARWFERFDMKAYYVGGTPPTLYVSPYRSPAKRGDVTFEFFGIVLQNGEFQRNLNTDLMMTFCSILFVLFWMTIHTGSFFIAGMGMCQMLMTLFVSFFIYRFIFQITFFAQMQVLAIFLVLGVGADDIFVLVDAWKQSLLEVPRGEGESLDAHMQRRLTYAYRRATAAIFNTSFTTAMAFVATGINPIMSISCFGWYSSICIAVLYLLTITWIPSVLIVHEKFFAGGPICCPCLRRGSRAKKDEETGGEEQAGDAEPKDDDCLGRFFKNIYVPAMTRGFGSKKIRLVPLGILVALIAYGIQGSIFTSQLTPPTKSERWFTPDHMYYDIQDRMVNDYMGGADNNYIPMSFVWGITGIDRSEYNKYLPDEKRGTALFDTDFDIYPAANQQKILDMCDTIEAAVCRGEDGSMLEGCSGSDSKLTRANTMECFMREFHTWHRDNYNGTSPANATAVNRATFLARLRTFRGTTRPANNAQSSWKSQIGFINGQLKFVRVSFLSSVQILKPVGTKMPVYNFMNRMVDDFKAGAPAGLKSLFQEGGRIGWLWMRTELALVEGLVLGLAICFPIALMVLMMATRNFIISFFATSSIGFIVVSVLGFCRLNGWDLGIAESIAGIIVIGFSVDYVVHMSHMYIEAGHKMHLASRTERFRYAAEKMGQTVIGGAVTTAGSGLFMFFCQLTFFSKMAVLICVTIMFSFLYSLGFFMSILALVGPEGNLGDLNAYFCKSATDAAKPRGAKVGADQEGGMEMVAAQPDA